MRVLYITPSLGAGGAERQASILLPGLRRRGIDARALALDSGGPFVKPLREDGVPVDVLNMRHQLDFGPLIRSELVREFAPEAIVSRGVSGVYVGHALARWRGAAHVYNDHRPVGVELGRRRVAMLGLLARHLSSVIVVSEDQRQGWLEYGCQPERIAVIANGVSAHGTLAPRSEIRRELAIPDSSVVALLVASLRPAKRVPDFVRGVLRARETCPELIGVVVGDGVERSAVQRAAAGDPAIRLLGQRDDVPRVLQAADLLVLTSAQEALPMAILEAMAAGLPVIATRVGGVGELVAHGETGLLVPPADPEALVHGLVRLVSDPELRLAMGRVGRRRCSDGWDAERMIDSYLEVLQRALPRTPAPASGSDAPARGGGRQASGAPSRNGHARALAGGGAAGNGRPAELAHAQRPTPLLRPLAGSFLRYVDRKGWVTWEQAAEDARVLMVTNAWPDRQSPTRAPFLRYTIEGLTAAGLDSDLLYVRGDRGKHCYLIGCAAMALVPLARPGKYRLVHSHGGETALVARFFRGAPVLATYWGSDLLGPQEGSRNRRLKAALASRLLRVHALLMTATTTKSEEMERLLPTRAQDRNSVIPDGVDISLFRPMDRAGARAALGWPADHPTVISVGRRAPMKRLWLAQQAAALAAKEIDTLRWLVISDIPPAKMPLYYSAADLLLHTSSSEGSPNVVKEALACNLPVVATCAGDIADLLKGVQPSALCESEPEALAREIVRFLREGSRSNGRERIARLRVEEATAQTLACYRSLGAPLPVTH